MDDLQQPQREQFNPYQWPPHIPTADVHSQATMPGKYDPSAIACPCCSLKPRIYQSDWIRRSLKKDLSSYGGAIYAYFALLFYFIFAIIVIILVFSIYQIHTINKMCNLTQEKEKAWCLDAFGVWIISQKQLLTLMKDKGQSAITLKVLQAIVFVFLLISNSGILWFLTHLKKSLKKKTDLIHNYSLSIKHVPQNMNIDELKNKIFELVPDIKIKQIFFLQKFYDYHVNYQKRMDQYFAIKYYNLKGKTKKLRKARQKFVESHQNLKKAVQKMKIHSGRAVIVCQLYSDKKKLNQKLSLSFYKKFTLHLKHIWYKYIKKTLQIPQQTMYADTMPQMQQIFWKNFGQQTIHKTMAKIYTTCISIISLTLCYVVLRFAIIKANSQEISHEIPVSQKFWSFGLGWLLLFFAISFRLLMNYFSDLRRPNTHQQKSLFIISSTVLYHFVFYLLLPTIYFTYQAVQCFNQGFQSSMKLFAISFQALLFLIFQLVIAMFDMFYCCWNLSRNKLLNPNKQKSKQYCQKKLHQVVSYPRFPIQFKLIILFKTWSFVIFYSFEMPYILILMLILLLLFYLMDKRSIYTHYKIDAVVGIDLEVIYLYQQSFMRIYTNFFSIYLCLIYCINQRQSWERLVAISLTVIVIIFQTLYSFVNIRQEHEQQLNIIQKMHFSQIILQQNQQVNGSQKPLLIHDSCMMKQQIQIQHQSYLKIYKSFLNNYNNPQIQLQLTNYFNLLQQNPQISQTQLRQIMKQSKHSQTIQTPNNILQDYQYVDK